MLLTEAPARAATLVEVLQRRAHHQPDRVACRFLDDGGDDVHLTYRQLDRHARAVAVRLQQEGQAGARAVLLYPQGLDFVAAFFGCLYAGVVPVPTHLPRRRDAPDERLDAIVRDARPGRLLTTRHVAERLPPLPTPLPVVATDNVVTEEAAMWSAPAVGPDTLALLQYTSGSTGTPRGVMVTHDNLLHNHAQMAAAFQHGPDTVCVTWLPLFHDMGLIGNVLYALSLGGTCVLLAPSSFLKQPARWLRAITAYGGTFSGGPNFGFDLCVQRIAQEERARLDLSTWRSAFSGAEPVRAGTIARFTEAFAACGFRPEAFCPSYGLAEATLFVTGGQTGRPPSVLSVDAQAFGAHTVVPARAGAEAVPVVGCGRSHLGLETAIVDPEARTRCPEGTVGEIWVAGPSVAQGYWNRPEETDETFRARLASDPPPASRRYLRTGDLGFLREDELFVTGRLKDLIILRGRNVYPHDLEWTVSRCHPLLREDTSAAFSVEAEDEERLVVVQAVAAGFDAGRSAPEVVAAIQQALEAHHEVSAWRIVLVRAGHLPVTTSGKIRRRTCRQHFLDGSLPAVYTYRQPDQPSAAILETHLAGWPAHPSHDEALRRLTQLFAAILDGAEVAPGTNLFDAGVDSLTLYNVLMVLEEQTGAAFPAEVLATEPTLDHLAHLLAGRTPGRPRPAAVLPPEAVAAQVSMRARLHNRLVHGGPQARSFALPYGPGTHLLRALTGNARFQEALYAREKALVERCLEDVAYEGTAAEAVQLSLMTNSWPTWRRRVLRDPAAWERWVTVEGRDAVDQAVRRGCGVIVAFHHTLLKKLLRGVEPLREMQGIIGHVGPDDLGRVGMTTLAEAGDRHTRHGRAALRTAQLVHARRALRQGGTILILADDTEGTGGIWLPFHGRWRPFRTGTAELAVSTGAAVVPLFASMDTAGRITFAFQPALLPEEREPEDVQVEHLTRRYAALFAAHWTAHLGSLEWFILRKHLHFPRLEPDAG